MQQPTTDEWLAQAGSLGEQLRAVRKKARLTGDALAGSQSWPQSKVSKIENGRQLPTDEDITAWAAACNADEAITTQLLETANNAQLIHRAWRVQIRSGQVAAQRRYTDLVRKASLIRNAEVVLIPGLLQTPDYARARLVEHAWVNRDDLSATVDDVAEASRWDIDAAVTERMRRQQLLYEPGRDFEFILTEAVLRTLLCSAEVMLGQLDRLLAITDGMPNVSLGVIPFGIHLPFTPQNGYILLDDLAVVETIGSETMLRGEEAAAYVRAWRYLSAQAVVGADARSLILRAIDAIAAR